MTEPAKELTRPVYPQITEDGRIVYRSVLTAEQQKVRAACVVVPDRIIPLIFLPGIMGSRLRSKKDPKKVVWDPPSEDIDGVLPFANYAIVKGPVRRQIELDPDDTVVDTTSLPKGKDRNVPLTLTSAVWVTSAGQAIERGWGQVYSDCYMKILDTLEAHCNRMFLSGGVLSDFWKTQVLDKQHAAAYLDAPEQKGQPGQALGAQKPFAPLDETELRRVAEALYPVHAVGYNWVRSNQEAAERLRDEIDRIMGYYQSLGKTCDKVILITHSMGGLVARLAVQLPGVADKVLGVLHGAMPATGAPAAYKRMRAGFEKIG